MEMSRKRSREPEEAVPDGVTKKPHIVIDDLDNDLVKYLQKEGFSTDICKVFEDHKITFNHLSHINSDFLLKMGIRTVGMQIDLLKCLSRINTARHIQGDEKVFNDPIHGHIELHPLLIKIIDTPQFQRLRYIKQLGGGYFVFPGASHNRFEHSIGVAYLAGEFVDSISRRQPELYINPSDILCVKIAGLCHDLGHGPFSHMFDGDFITKATGSREWKHEQGSVLMFDHLIDSNNLRPLLLQNGLSDNDLIFIKELIVGPPLAANCDDIQSSPSSSPWLYKGRHVDKSFLYEIVANKRTGIDVDKWDYFARDCHCLGIPNNFDWKRYTKFARVVKVNNRYQICCRDKEVTNLYEMFHTRASLHRRAYKHKTAKIAELMITEALLKADDHIFIPGKDNQPVKMSQAIHDPYAYTHLNDSIIFNILQSTKPELELSKEILVKLHKRQLYKCIGQTQPTKDSQFDSDNIEDDICEQMINSTTPMKGGCNLTVDDIIVKVVSFDYGMGEKNPIDEMRFYTKQNPNVAVKVCKDQVSQMLPHTFGEKTVRVYCKKLDKPSLRAARRCFAQWCLDQGGLKGDELRCSQLDDNESQEEAEPFNPYGTPFGTPMNVGNGSEDTNTTSRREDGMGERVKKKLTDFL